MTTAISDEMILGAIEKGLSKLGENPKQATWLFLEKVYKINKQDVAKNLDQFQKALQQLFGSGSKFLDDLFREHLAETTHEDLTNFTSFVKCVAELRNKQTVNEEASDQWNSISKMTMRPEEAFFLLG